MNAWFGTPRADTTRGRAGRCALVASAPPASLPHRSHSPLDAGLPAYLPDAFTALQHAHHPRDTDTRLRARGCSLCLDVLDTTPTTQLNDHARDAPVSRHARFSASRLSSPCAHARHRKITFRVVGTRCISLHAHLTLPLRAQLHFARATDTPFSFAPISALPVSGCHAFAFVADGLRGSHHTTDAHAACCHSRCPRALPRHSAPSDDILPFTLLVHTCSRHTAPSAWTRVPGRAFTHTDVCGRLRSLGTSSTYRTQHVAGSRQVAFTSYRAPLRWLHGLLTYTGFSLPRTIAWLHAALTRPIHATAHDIVTLAPVLFLTVTGLRGYHGHAGHRRTPCTARFIFLRATRLDISALHISPHGLHCMRSAVRAGLRRWTLLHAGHRCTFTPARTTPFAHGRFRQVHYAVTIPDVYAGGHPISSSPRGTHGHLSLAAPHYAWTHRLFPRHADQNCARSACGWTPRVFATRTDISPLPASPGFHAQTPRLTLRISRSICAFGSEYFACSSLPDAAPRHAPRGAPALDAHTASHATVAVYQADFPDPFHGCDTRASLPARLTPHAACGVPLRASPRVLHTSLLSHTHAGCYAFSTVSCYAHHRGRVQTYHSRAFYTLTLGHIVEPRGHATFTR